MERTRNASVQKIVINDTIFFPQTAISILVISNHENFIVLLDKIASYILFEKCINILALEMASPRNRHCVSYIGTLSFPIPTTRHAEIGTVSLPASSRCARVRK